MKKRMWNYCLSLKVFWNYDLLEDFKFMQNIMTNKALQNENSNRFSVELDCEVDFFQYGQYDLLRNKYNVESNLH